ncbi:MAG: DotI/IcmL/TraM family protein [Gammaproteobacteria bacterium]|nr:DotI/IcmL/TraM family protein [Gammaproteobacteria bacterium]
MGGETKVISDDALVMIFTRNEFYRRKYRLIVGVAALGIFVIMVLAGMLFYLVKNPRHPLYFVTDGAGRFIQEIPVQRPNMSVDDVLAWSQDAVEAAFSYDFMNYRSQLQNAQKYFTDFGWRSYMKGLQDSNNLLALTERKFVVIAKVVAPPKLLAQGPIGKTAIYGYKIEMPVLVSYLKAPLYDEKSRIQNPLLVTVIVERQDLLSSYKGLGIVQMIAARPDESGDQSLVAPS